MENIGTIISILVGLATLLSMLIWFGRFIQRVNVHDKKLDEVSDEVKSIAPNVVRHDKKLDELVNDVNEVKKIVPMVYMHDKKLDSMVEGISQIREGMASMRSVLLMKFKDLEPALSGKRSPRTLTEQGLKIFHDMKGEEFLKKNKAALFSVIDRDKPKTAYDVENLCYFACASFVNDDMFNEIKSFLYNYPTVPWSNGKEHEVNMDDACSVLSLPLRDMYLEEHPEVIR